MNTAEARELCRGLYLETLQSLDVASRLKKTMCLRDGVLETGKDEAGRNSYPLSPSFSSSLSSSRPVRIVSFGKAAIPMAAAAAEILDGAKLRGIVVSPNPAAVKLPGFEHFQAGHPYPDEGSWKAAEAALALVGNCSRDDLVLFLISGGGSALLEKPLHPSVSLEDLRRFHKVLVTCGASIEEINVLRKHFSAVKGGRLAVKAAPATQVTFYVSDVPERFPSMVASGPTMPDESTVEDCRRIAGQYSLMAKFPESIRTLLESGQVPETPKPGDPAFAQNGYYCLLSNRDAVEKLTLLANARGVLAETDLTCDDWTLSRARDHLLQHLADLHEQRPGRPVMLVSGGELSSPVTGTGRGGRNQAFVLDCVGKITGKRIVVLSAGTDGIDGNSPAAGALADGETSDRAAAFGMKPKQFLSEGDSYSFFEKLGDAIVTGPTGTNVRDVRILLSYA